MSINAQIDQLLQQGIAAAKAGRKEEAHEALLQVVDLDERNEQGWLWLSGVVETSEERRICLENVLAINPDNAHAQAGLHWLEQHAPQPPAAFDLCPRCEAQVSSAANTCPYCGLPLIVTCPACGQYTDVSQTSCPDCGQLLGDFREGARYHLTLAQAHLDRRRIDPAQEAIAHAEAESPDDPQVLQRVAELYQQSGRPDLAITAYERTIRLAPDHAPLYARLGSLYRRYSRPAEARMMFEKAAQLAGQDPAILLELAQLYIEEGSAASEAFDLLQQVVQIQPMNVQAHLLLGDACLSQGDREQARLHYENARKLTSRDSATGLEARRKLGQLQDSLQPQAGIEDTRPGNARSAAARQRPGCITIYAILMAVGALASALGTIGVAILLGSSRIQEAPLMADAGQMVDLGQLTDILGVVFAVALVTAAVNLAIAIGLWAMKNWARIAMLVLLVLGFLGNLAQAAIFVFSFRAVSTSSGLQALPIPFVGGVMVGFVIQGYIIFWFVANRDLFD